ncbi:uncharacterized protein METZ01_LOCUS481186 [marine metagenome]|uniref:Uncharacterized protein n=1 Tax=marine metagenome TaxID=408172 RepID=A0A383C804_9ZZZZ
MRIGTSSSVTVTLFFRRIFPIIGDRKLNIGDEAIANLFMVRAPLSISS